jgi:hypothetical protein
MIIPAQYGSRSKYFHIAPYGPVFDTLLGTIRDAGGELRLHPAIGDGLGLLEGCYGNWPAGPTYHRFHPARDFADEELDHDLKELKFITTESIQARSEGPRRMRIVDGPKVGLDMAEQMYNMALDLMEAKDGNCTFIAPLGPADWLGPLRDMFITSHADLTGFKYGNMDEFLIGRGVIVPSVHPLSFRAMIEREFVTPLVNACGLKRENIKIPDPYAPADYDDWLMEYGVDCCYAGKGWGVHIAFVDPSTGLVWILREDTPGILIEIRALTFEEMSTMGIMEVTLDAVSNMQTALHSGGGNWYEALTTAYSIGLKQILLAERIRVWMDGFVNDNQTWQRWCAKTAFLPKFTALLPATVTLACPDVEYIFAKQVADQALGELH